MTRFLLLLAVAACVVLGFGQGVSPAAIKRPGRTVESLTFGSHVRRFTLVVPKSYDGSKPIPLVVLLHGWGGSSSSVLSDTGFAEKANVAGFAVVAPQGLGQIPGWNVGYLDLSGTQQDDVGFVGAVILAVGKEVSVDPKAVYLVGHSNGAMLAHLCASRLANHIAAFAAVAGTIGLPASKDHAEQTISKPTEPVPAILFHGRQDDMVAYAAGSNALLKSIGAVESATWWARQNGDSLNPTKRALPGQAGSILSFPGPAEVQLVTLDGGNHDWPSYATSMIWDFFASHRRP